MELDKTKLPWAGRHPPKKKKDKPPPLVVTKGCYVAATILGPNKRKRKVQQEVKIGRGVTEKAHKMNSIISDTNTVNDLIP